MNEKQTDDGQNIGQSREFFVDAISGWVGGAISTTVVQPVDTILTRVQSVSIPLKAASSPSGVRVAMTAATSASVTSTTTTTTRTVLHSVFRNGGYKAFFRGLPAATMVIPLQNMLLFVGYGVGERWSKMMEHKGDQTSGESRLITGSRLTPVFMGGVCGGIVQSFVVAPSELLKVNPQVRGGSAKDVAENGKLRAVDEQLPHAPHVYAIGDVLDGRPELTPVAIEAGLRLARRLFGSGNERMDYENVATTVFTPLEYGAIGLSEDEATASLGAENVECYISEFTPLEHALSDARSARGDAAFAKLVCDKTQDLKVIGFHYLGPNAGEITQGFSVAMRKGATYGDFLGTVGIHPTVAEEFTTLTVTKASGVSAAKGGC